MASERAGAIAKSPDALPAVERIERAGLARLFTEVIGGDRVEDGKPAPEI